MPTATALDSTGLRAAIREHSLTPADVALYLRLNAAERGEPIDPATCTRIARDLCATAH